MSRSTLTVWVVALLLLVASCSDGSKTGNSGTKTGNSDQIDILVRAVNAPATESANTVGGRTKGMAPDPVVTEDAQGSVFEIQMAMLSLNNLKLFFADNIKCTDLDEYEFIGPVACSGNHLLIVGPLVVDLTTGDSVPSLSDLTVPLLNYSSANLNTIPGDPEMGVVMEDGVLDDVTLFLEGEFECAAGFTECTGIHAFEASLRFERTVPFTGDPFTFDESTQSLALNLETDDWFTSQDLTQCLEDADLSFEMDGRLIIRNGEGPCNNVETEITNAFAASGRLGGTISEAE